LLLNDGPPGACRAARSTGAGRVRQDRYGPDLRLDYKDTRDEALKCWSGWATRTASLFDPDGRVGIDYGVYGVPETYVIDRTGTIRTSRSGRSPEILHDKIVPLLRKLNA